MLKIKSFGCHSTFIKRKCMTDHRLDASNVAIVENINGTTVEDPLFSKEAKTTRQIRFSFNNYI